jgi:hypothetical protein
MLIPCLLDLKRRQGGKLIGSPDDSSIRLGRLFVYIFLHKLNKGVYDIVLAVSGRVG